VSVAKSLNKLVFLYQWHWCLGYVRSRKIEEVLWKGLLNRSKTNTKWRDKGYLWKLYYGKEKCIPTWYKC